MQSVKRRRTHGRNRRPARLTADCERLNFDAPTARPPEAMRGVQLKTVSLCTMLFALACLGAFMAGRPPVSAAGPGITGAMERPTFTGLRTAAYHVKDLRKAKQWYASVLGIQPYFDQPYYVGFHVDGYELGLIPTKRAKAKRQPSGVAYWGVSDARAAYRRLVKLGAKQLEPVRNVGDGILVGTVHDPFGNVLGIIQNGNLDAPAR